MKIGVISHLYPTLKRPALGVFVKDELDNLAKNVEIHLFAPYPNRLWLTRDNDNSHIPYPALRPFVLAYPRFFFQHRYPGRYAAALKCAEQDGFFNGCDLIHAHNAFPEGVAAIKVFGGNLGQVYH